MHTLLARPSKHQTEKQITAHTVGLHSLLGTPLLYCIITEQVVVNLICLTFHKDVSLESSKRKVYCNKRREKEHSEWWHISLHSVPTWQPRCSYGNLPCWGLKWRSGSSPCLREADFSFVSSALARSYTSDTSVCQGDKWTLLLQLVIASCLFTL